MHRLIFPVSMIVVASSVLRAQQPASTATGTGGVTGHIACGDSNLPARLAEVTLQTLNVRPDPLPGSKYEPGAPLRTYQTALDGSFAIPKVRSGTYYVVIKKAGYLSPITQFTRAELAQPTQEVLARIVKVVPTVTVENGHSSNVEVRLERGGTLDGTIRYDDGSPVATASVVALNKETKNGKDTWAANYSRVVTDDQGRYRITGLAAGEYLPRVGLELNEKYVSTVLGGSGSSSSNTKYSLTFYMGDTVRQNAGKTIKLQPGEERDGADIIIPVSKLHPVAGTISEARSGHQVNAGKLSLSYSDGDQLVSTTVDKEDGLFHFDFVPEGEYTLSAIDAKDVTRQEIPNPPGTYPPFETKETTIKEYGKTSQPLLVNSDVSNIVVTVTDKPIK